MNYTYQKKPVAIEAFRMTAERSMDNSEWPTWLHKAWNNAGGEGCLWIDRDAKDRRFMIGTDEGTLRVVWGDWIIRGVKGEIYPCRNDIFEMTYEAVESEGLPEDA